jgi:hypothetical protein
MSSALRYRLLQAALISLPLAFGIAGCETMEKLNPFAEKQTPLPGERKALFPEGVPGVEFGAAPQQPGNSNIPISPSAAAEEQQNQQQQSQQQRPQSQTARTQPQSAPAPQPAPAKSKTSKGDPNDAWSGTR